MGVQIPTHEGAILEHRYGTDASWSALDNVYLTTCWRNPENMIEPSVCGGDAALSETTLMTCCL